MKKYLTRALSGIVLGTLAFVAVAYAADQQGGGGFSRYVPAAGVNTFLTTPSSANALAMYTDETGTGLAVFGTNPSFTTGMTFNGSSSGTTTLNPAATASGALLLPAASDTLVGKATTDTLTNKTLDTASNTIKIAGTSITSISGNTAKVATASGTLTSGNCVQFDSSGNIVDAGGACSTGGGGGTVSSGTAGQMTYYSSTGTTVVGNANATISAGALTLGVATSAQGSLKLSGSTSGTTTLAAPVSGGGTQTLQTGSDTIVGRATTDTLTNKTYDTAGTGNVFKINGTSITGISGNTATLANTSGALTSGNCAKFDANGNIIDAATTCGGGGSGTVTSVSVTTANGVSGSVATSTTTPAITLTLGAITPSSIVNSGSTTTTALIPSSSTIPTDGVYLPAANSTGIADNSQPVLKTVGVASGVDFLTLTNAATANPANLGIAASGTDSNVDITTTAKGTGIFKVAGGSNNTIIKASSSNTAGTSFDLVNTSASGHDLQFSSVGSAGSVGQFAIFDVTTNATAAAIYAGTNSVSAGAYFRMNSPATFGWSPDTQFDSTAADTGISRSAAKIVAIGSGAQGSTAGSVKLASVMSVGTKFTTSGCSVSSTTGGATAGTFTLGAASCTVVVTMNGATGVTAPNGWTCQAHDQTAIATIIDGESSSTTTTASFVIPVTAGATDVISFSCTGY